MNEPGRRYSIAVDFDGVLHQYTTPWIDAATIPDPPVPGAIDWLNTIQADYDLIIFTTRAETPAGQIAVSEYLVEHGVTVPFRVTAGPKPPALIYLDDRAWRFRGRFPTPGNIRGARPWKTGDAPRTSAKDRIAEANGRLRDLEGKQARLKQDRNELRLMLLAEILAGLGFPPDEGGLWLEAHADEPFALQLAAARAEPLRP